MCRVLIVSDIFGRSDGVQCLSAELSDAGANIRIVDPYASIFQRFSNEEHAYVAFLAQCGHDAYTERVQNALRQPFDMAIGFSAGASALWRAVADVTPPWLKQLVLFYPGQLHQHMQLTPKVATHIIFGASEHHFAVDDIVAKLKLKPFVHVVKNGALHGFMNPASSAFNEEAYQRYVLELQAMTTALSATGSR